MAEINRQYRARLIELETEMMPVDSVNSSKRSKMAAETHVTDGNVDQEFASSSEEQPLEVF